MKTYKPDQILYGQGQWKVRVVKDLGGSIEYLPLDKWSVPESEWGKTLVAAKELFKEKKRDKEP
ncbi:MAG: hypothetical protein C4555_03235 [Dehalococcoidia bacterium]|nr:MAG: hypothetical protein C4555_03235 [Dehalococcoidia bacterium]